MEVKPLTEDLGGGFEAFFPQLARGVVGYGATQQEAIAALFDAVPAFLEDVDETGHALPNPEASKEWDEFSGKFNVRMPKILHAKLARLSEKQGVSLNSLVQTILMSGATALEAGCEFGAIVRKTLLVSSTAIAGRFTWDGAEGSLQDVKRSKASENIGLTDYRPLQHERNPHTWETANENGSDKKNESIA